MNLCGEIVVHKAFGKGEVISMSNGHITILFYQLQQEKTFKYPAVFGEFMEIQNYALKSLIQDEKDRAEQIEAEAKRVQEEVVIKKVASFSKKTKDGNQIVDPTAMTNIAFKCTYCDGGSSDNSIGFSGICSDEIIKYNINEAKHIWCSGNESLCKKCLQGKISRDELIQEYSANGFICYESQMLKLWRAYAGINQTGRNKGKPMTLKNVRSNSLAILTTRLPYDNDENRFVFAVFLVHENYEGDNKEEGYVGANPNYKIQLTLNEAKQVKFWDFYYNRNKPELIKFGSGLHRYLSDVQAAQILKKICEVKKGTKDEIFANKLLDHFCTIKEIVMEDLSSPNGALSRMVKV